MKRTTAGIVLGLLLLVAAAILFHREAREEKPKRPPKTAPVADVAPAEPPPVAAAPADVPPSPPPRRAAPAPAIVEPPLVVLENLKNGTVRGVVKISGVPPKRKRVGLDADPKCADLHPVGLLRDDIVVDPENNVRWAFVYVAHGVKGAPKGILTPVLLDQVGCRFEPRVLGVRVNQPINIFNNDRLLHNVHALPFENREFNFGLPKAGQFATKSFSRPEIMIKIKCEIHPWMEAWVGVLDHPYFSVTSETGSYGIVDLAPGRYTIKVWHEKYATVERDVEVPSGGDVRLDFLLDARRP